MDYDAYPEFARAKAPTKDFKIRRNRQTQRKNSSELWDVTVAGIHIITCTSKVRAQFLADQMNIDPDYLERGQTLADRQAQTPYIVARA